MLHEHVVSSMSIRYDPLPPEEEEDIPRESNGREFQSQGIRDSSSETAEAVLVAIGVAVAIALVLFVG